jgi:hypothetical protein
LELTLEVVNKALDYILTRFIDDPVQSEKFDFVDHPSQDGRLGYF